MISQVNQVLQDLIQQSQSIDYTQFLAVIPTAIVCYVANVKLRNYKLRRKNDQLNNCLEVSVPPELNVRYSDVDINRFVEMKYGEKISNFTTTIINSFPIEDLKIFLNNINSLKTRKKKKTFVEVILKLKPSAGSYNEKKNEIALFEEVAGEYDVVIYHELFHMASSIEKDGVFYSGFSQYNSNNKTTIGKGINEGYTEIITHRYFGNNYRSAWSYMKMQRYVKGLENIIGKEKMQSLYLNANLSGLIDELQKYIPKNIAIGVIQSIDFIFSKDDCLNLTEYEEKKLSQCYQTVCYYLVFCFTKKLMSNLKEGKISLDELRLSVNEYAMYFCSPGKTSETEKLVSEILDTVLGLEPINNVNTDISSIKR